MLSKPSTCSGCPLVGISTGFMKPSLAGVDGYRVALVGEALGEDEADQGKPFVGLAGRRLNRLIEWAGLERDKFDVFNTVWCRPPGNKLEGTPYETSSITHCKDKHWESLLSRSKVVVPMGNVATSAFLGRKGILGIRGYIEGRFGVYILPTVHPSFIQRGQSKWSAPFINDLQKAVELARDGYPPQIVSFVLDPSPMEAYKWAQEYREHLAKEPATKLAFDIETPGKGDEEDEADSSSDAPDKTWTVERVGFAYRPFHALSIPFAPEYRASISMLLGGIGDKVVWNAGFDVPRLRRVGVDIRGTIHDGMVAWHILHSDLPKSLRFVATFTCPYQPAWKHLSGARPAFYNATDADVELRSMVSIQAELERTGLWEVYKRDVLDLEPILVHMHEKGMRVDPDIRLDRAIKLADRLRTTKDELEQSIPMEARKIAKVYERTPPDTSTLKSRPSTRRLLTCAVCGAERPRKDHFKRFVKKVNPCADAGTQEREVEVTEFYRLAEFTPSRDALIRYHRVINRSLPTVWDKKQGARRVSFGEREIKNLQGRYPLDKVYPLVLSYREIDKLAGTYVGRPEAVLERISGGAPDNVGTPPTQV